MGNINNTTYEDERLTEIETEKQQTLTETENTYQGMIDNSADFYQKQIDASKEWTEKQTELQNEQTDFAIEQIEQQKEQAEKDYQKEQSAAYVDYQKMSNDYSVGAEERAASGFSRSGFSESSQVAIYTAYQNRVATAREAVHRAFQNYDNQMTEARLQNNVALAQLAHDGLMAELQYEMEAFQYGNQLLLEKLNSKLNINTTYHTMQQNVLSQINQENALAEEIRQFNESKALQEKQLAEEQRQFNEQMAYTKSKSSGGGSSSSGSVSGYSNEGQKVNKEESKGPTGKAAIMQQQSKKAANSNLSDKEKAILQSIGMNRTVEGKVNAIQNLVKQGTISESEAEKLLAKYVQ